jgi:hypothetical protein
MSILASVIERGTRAAQPAATTVATGTLYFVTDELVTERSNGTTWDSYSATTVGGNVVGPASAVSHNLAGFNGTTGKLIEDSGIAESAVVTLTGSQVLTNKTLTLPIIASISNGGTVTIPSGADTLVAKTSSDVLTNKTLTTPILTGVIPLEAATSGHPALKASAAILQFRLGDDSNYAAIAAAGATFNKTYYSPLVSDGNTSTAITIDWSIGNEHSVTMTGNCTFTFSNPTSGMRLVLVVYTGAGSFTATWPGTVKWPGGVAPVISVGASKTDVLSFFYDGTNYLGAFAQAFA